MNKGKIYGEFLKVLRRKYKKMNTGEIYGENTKTLRRINESFRKKLGFLKNPRNGRNSWYSFLMLLYSHFWVDFWFGRFEKFLLESEWIVIRSRMETTPLWILTWDPALQFRGLCCTGSGRWNSPSIRATRKMSRLSGSHWGWLVPPVVCCHTHCSSTRWSHSQRSPRSSAASLRGPVGWVCRRSRSGSPERGMCRCCTAGLDKSAVAAYRLSLCVAL